MSNHYFRFKQFTVHQEHCAMKVCTDACLFGAWLGAVLTRKAITAHHALDIGTGTGLLSLMLAQQLPTTMIHAVEIDAGAVQQAVDNFKAAPWKDRLQVTHSAIQDFSSSVLYDLIFSNPPFFEQQLKSGNEKRNLALHSQELRLDELVPAAKNRLRTGGHLALLIPYYRHEYLIQLANANGFFLQEHVAVKQTPQHGCFRSMLLLGSQPVEALYSELIIRDGSRYTPDFSVLLEDFYLNS